MARTLMITLVAVLVVGAAANATPPNMLVNPSFESPVLLPGGSMEIWSVANGSQSIDGWKGWGQGWNQWNTGTKT